MSSVARRKSIGACTASFRRGGLRTAAIIQFGLLLLIATPIARVAVSLIGFALERDRTYVVVTSIVLAILIYSVVGEH